MRPAFWRFALLLSCLLSLFDTASDVAVIVLLAHDRKWAGFGMTLGFTIVPNFVIGWYEAKELAGHGATPAAQALGLGLSCLGLGVVFTAVRAITDKDAHSGVGAAGFPVAHFRAVRLLEVMFESVPQAILQTYFAIEGDKLSFSGTLTIGEVLFRLSIVFSLVQIAFFLTSLETTGSSAFDGFSFAKLCTAATLLFVWRVGEVGSRVFLLSLFANGFAAWAAIVEVAAEGVLLLALVGVQQVLRWALRSRFKRLAQTESAGGTGRSRVDEIVVGLPPAVSGHQSWEEATRAAALAAVGADRPHPTPTHSRTAASIIDGSSAAGGSGGDASESDKNSEETTIIYDSTDGGGAGASAAAVIMVHGDPVPGPSPSPRAVVEAQCGPRHRRTATPQTLTDALTSPVLASMKEFKAVGRGDYGLMAMGLPVFFVSDARGYNELGEQTGLYEARTGQGLSNLSRGIIPAALYFTVRAISQVVIGMLIICGGKTSTHCSLTDLAGDLKGWSDGTTRVAIVCSIVLTAMMWLGLGFYRWLVNHKRHAVLKQRANWAAVAEMNDDFENVDHHAAVGEKATAAIDRN